MQATIVLNYSSTSSDTPLGNWAQEWRAAHTENVDWYNCGAAHSDPLNANQKAYAAWAMYVEIARMITLEDVPAKLTVSDTLVGNTESACFDATDTITVAGDGKLVEFSSGSSVDIIAGKSISLLPGFHAFEGSLTHATITTSSQFCFSSLKSIQNGNKKTSKSVILDPSVLKNEKPVIEKKVKIFPNPNDGRFTLELTNFEGPSTVSIVNTLGSIVCQTILTDQSLSKLELTSLQKGLYFVTVKNGETSKTSKMVIQ